MTEVWISRPQFLYIDIQLLLYNYYKVIFSLNNFKTFTKSVIDYLFY